MSQNFVCQNCNQNLLRSDLQAHGEICRNTQFKQTFRRPLEKDTSPNQKDVNTNSDPYYEMKQGMVTFGRISNPDSKNIENSSSTSNIFKKNNSIKKDKPNSEIPTKSQSNERNSNANSEIVNDKITEREINEKDISLEKYNLFKSRDIITNVPDKFGGIGILNSITDNNSFLSTVIQTVWNLQLLRSYLIYDVDISESDTKNKLIFHLKNCLVKYSQNLNSSSKLPIDISKIRVCLSEIFQSRRKFILEHPDDPIDTFFAILNSLHSFYIKKNLNEINDTSCNSKCFTHKYIWMDLLKKEECECKGTAKRLFSNHNYIFDIPILKLFEVCDNFNKIEMDKCFKLKSSKLSEDFTRNLYDIKGKLFIYLKALISQNSSNCPEKGLRCSINQTNKQLFLTNFPYYLSFSLNPQSNSLINNPTQVLKTFLLIPKIFDLNLIFENSKENVFYEFLGCILRTNNRTYSCLFFQKNFNSKEYIYYVDEQIYYFKTFFEVLCRLLKSQEMPILIIFQKLQEKYNMDIAAADKDLTENQVEILQNYAKNIENTAEILSNQFRPIEEIIKIESIQVNNSTSNEDTKNINSSSPENKFKRASSLNNNNNVSNFNSTNFPTNTSSNSVDFEYTCSLCGVKNKIENKICQKCNRNNEHLIKENINKRKSVEKTNNDCKNSNENPGEVGSKLIGNNNKPKTLNSNNSAINVISNNIIEKEMNKISNDIVNNIKEKPVVVENIKSQEDDKYMNMPKQMKSNNSKKEINIVKPEKSLNEIIQNICKICNKEITKCLCDSKKKNKSKATDDDLPNEDRLKPYTSTKKEGLIREVVPEWICVSCRNINKITMKKCSKCQKPNKSHLDVDNFSSNNTNSVNPLKNVATSVPPRNLSDKPRSDLIDQNLKNVSPTPNNLFKKSSDCICLKIDDDNLFINNTCKLCKKLRPERSVRMPAVKEVPNLTKKNSNAQVAQNINNNIFKKTSTPDITDMKSNYFNPNQNLQKKFSEVKVTNINNNININNNFINTSKIDKEIIKDNLKIKSPTGGNSETLRFEIRSNSLGSGKNDTNLQNNRYNNENIEVQNGKKDSNKLNLETKNFRSIEPNLTKQKTQSVDTPQASKFKQTNKNETINVSNLSKFKK